MCKFARQSITQLLSRQMERPQGALWLQFTTAGAIAFLSLFVASTEAHGDASAERITSEGLQLEAKRLLVMIGIMRTNTPNARWRCFKKGRRPLWQRTRPNWLCRGATHK